MSELLAEALLLSTCASAPVFSSSCSRALSGFSACVRTARVHVHVALCPSRRRVRMCARARACAVRARACCARAYPRTLFTAIVHPTPKIHTYTLLETNSCAREVSEIRSAKQALRTSWAMLLPQTQDALLLKLLRLGLLVQRRHLVLLGCKQKTAGGALKCRRLVSRVAFVLQDVPWLPVSPHPLFARQRSLHLPQT